MLEGKQRVHLIGIGGCSMNGLAQILRAKGYEVAGSDRDSSPFTERLDKMGVPVFIGHKAEQVGDAQAVIYSAAIKKDNVERVAARERGIPEIERSVVLGEISSQYKQVVGIAGCHGKTTITSMLARIAQFGKLDATVHVGGDVDFLSGGTRVGSDDLFITEACEYVESFLTLSPTIAVVNNIDDDHLDYFRDIEHITEAFSKFLRLIPGDGLFLGCADDERVRELLQNPPHPVRTVSYGFSDSDYMPGDVRFDEEGNSSFNVLYRGENLGRITLMVPGRHNIINALAACAVSLALGETFADVAEGLSGYTLTRRRFEYYGDRDGVKYYHDYAHHPAEVAAVLDSASRVPKNKLWCVFQCNSYTRAKTLFTKNVTCFELADEVLVPDIYPGRETDDGSVHARDMVAAINEHEEAKAQYIKTFEEIREYLTKHARPGDLVITLGSGDVYKQTRKLL
jgi:UDP-N-acetylmuramate--alanine ligase